ncbi:MAG: hypothetical protein C0623_14280 [Desulfuromonas sp.]|nr:MAG: hypothetical protein C0623_14280 [Desulfuromonas sp.]
MMNESLSQANYCRVIFDLEFQEPFLLEKGMMLRLRREFKRVSRTASNDPIDQAWLETLLEPDLSADPFARRLYQKPSPRFVLKPFKEENLDLDAGDQFSLEVLFFGECGAQISTFCSLLRRLGRLGLYRGEGKFELINLGAFDQAENLSRVPIPDDDRPAVSLPLRPLAWQIDSSQNLAAGLRLRFETPARLLSNNKPTFKPNFHDIFPFMLRRVTSMLYTCYGIEMVDDAQYLVDRVSEIETVSSELYWHDWRTMEGDKWQDIGGIVGIIHLGRIDIDEVLNVIVMSSLFHIGKSASYGCGSISLELAPR